MLIGIIGAMELEVSALLARMQHTEERRFAGLRYVRGTLCGKDVVLCRCGPGKVNAALCTQGMVDAYHPDCIINIGVAGGIGAAVQITDVVVADAVCQHDIDTTAVGDEPGYISGVGMVHIACDPALCKALFEAARAAGCTVHRGGIASGDQFIAAQAQRERIASGFGALAVEMEGGSIGHVCHLNGVPFGVLRCISDGGADSAQLEYPAFCALAAKKSMEIMGLFLSGQI